jgi:hypothetical protein
MAVLALLVEGSLDETVARRLAAHCGHSVDVVYGKRGFGYIRTNISAFNLSPSTMPIVVLADSMDMHESCPPATVARLLPKPSPNMRFRLAVREIEAWLLADQANIARFLGVPSARIPSNPDAIQDPKSDLIRTARQSSKLLVRRLIPPQPGFRSREGPGYTSELQRFVVTMWDISSAESRSESLRRCVADLATIK